MNLGSGRCAGGKGGGGWGVLVAGRGAVPVQHFPAAGETGDYAAAWLEGPVLVAEGIGDARRLLYKLAELRDDSLVVVSGPTGCGEDVNNASDSCWIGSTASGGVT